MVNRPKVSVILTSYNHSKYIAKSIATVLEQDFQDFELLIIDDCSSDNSVEIINSFKDEKIRFIQNEKNLGMVGTINKGIENAYGEYIAHFNSDDLFYSKTKLSKQVKFLDANPTHGAVFTRAQLIDENDNIFKDPKHSYYLKMNQQQNQDRYAWLGFFFYNSNCLCYPSIMIRKSVYQSVGVYDPSYSIMQDLDMWIRICKKYDIFILEEDLTAFRISDSSTSCQKSNRFISVFEFKKLLNNYLNISSPDEFGKIFPELKCEKIEDANLVVIKKCLELDAKHKSFAVDFLFNSINSQKHLDKLKKVGIEYQALIRARNEIIIPDYNKDKKSRIALIYNADLHVASARMRAYRVLQFFKQNKIKPALEVYNEKNRANYNLVIFYKMFGKKNDILAQNLKKEGKKICLDLCDNYFYNPKNLESYNQHQQEFRKMAAIADVITLSSKSLRKIILENIPESRNKLTIIEDSFEDQIQINDESKKFAPLLGLLKYKFTTAKMIRLIWFGNASSKNVECGMSALLKIKDLIESYGKKYPICLTVISNDKQLYRKMIATWDVKTFYFKWKAATFISILKYQDAAVIPINKNPFTICKTSNRVIQSLHCGVDVIADSIPSYEEFSNYCFLDNWENGLKAVIKSKKDKAQKIKRIKAAKEIILSKYSIEIIAKKWLVLFNKIM